MARQPARALATIVTAAVLFSHVAMAQDAPA